VNFLRFMQQPYSRLFHFMSGSVLAIALGLALDLQAAQPQSVKPPAAAGGAKPAISEGSPPKAVFIMPSSPKEGADPFFPRSTGPYDRYIVLPKVPNTAPAVVTAELRLNGISGSAERRLAIINNRTFEAGEEGDVVSGSDRVRIRVLEIKSESVVTQFVTGGVRKELHLRKGL